ncbi:MAG: DNA (cytosine-5-)-methyltransferase [Clostridiales Family XIII bacterium]|nr:DNA (cytosine-5-)-methyltransferase [Clostridiales Family XIII bacterium]
MNLNRVRIKEAMDLIGIATYTELSLRLGITKNQLSFMLSDGYSPIKARVEDLCGVLNLAPSEIIENEKETMNLGELPSVDRTAVTAVELFAGAGGLALGLEKAGIDTIEYVEIDKFCCETLKKNRPFWNIVSADIAKVDFAKYKGKVDIVTGGFPCQAFSYAGKKLGFNDTRGTLFHEFARCVKEIEPTIFLAENVRGLLSHDSGRTFETIIHVLGELGYKMQYKVLNAAYYGVGQKRERILIIGTKDNVEYEFPEPESEMTKLRAALKDCPESEGQSYSKRKKEVLELVPPGGCWVNLPEDVQKDYLGASIHSGGGKRGMARRISWDEPCLTLTCSPSQKQTERCHPDETRPFTVREYARIQSFPDDWEFCGGIGEKYKQIGNAVPVEMARRIGVTLKDSIERYRSASS